MTKLSDILVSILLAFVLIASFQYLYDPPCVVITNTHDMSNNACPSCTKLSE